MGYLKNKMIEDGERGFLDIKGNVCHECFKDEYLKKFIINNATSKKCDYCENSSNDNIAIEFNKIMELIVKGIMFCFEDPINEIPYDSEEGGYMAPISDTWDIIDDLDITEDNNVKEKIVNSIQNESWVKNGYYSGSESEIFLNAWDNFKNIVKYKRRYTFLSKTNDYAIINSSNFLNELINYTERLSPIKIIKVFGETERIYRARIDKEYYQNAKNLGSPGIDNAKANRMSPAGIPMFYGAFDKETCVKEIICPNKTREENKISIGIFQPVRNLCFLDLSMLSSIPMPSIFDIANQRTIHPLKFFSEFSKDIAKDTGHDNSKNLEYIPTQIITEFFRYEYKTKDGNSIDGIIYESSKNKGHQSCVIFCENDQVYDINNAEPRKNCMLKLLDSIHKTFD